MNAGFLTDAGIDGRIQTSPAEFMTNLTVEASTNLDLAAESRSRPRGATRPDASDFKVPDEFTPLDNPRAQDIEVEHGTPAGPSREPQAGVGRAVGVHRGRARRAGGHVTFIFALNGA